MYLPYIEIARTDVHACRRVHPDDIDDLPVDLRGPARRLLALAAASPEGSAYDWSDGDQWTGHARLGDWRPAPSVGGGK